MTRNLLILTLVFLFTFGKAQIVNETIWWDPAQSAINVIEGRVSNSGLEFPYDRIPFEYKKNVRDAVSSLSEHSAGLMIRFRSNAEKIVVKYTVKGKLSMDHMPATGVSGVDLYAINSDGEELWCYGQRSFQDTISYIFAGLMANDNYHIFGREYRLYLPLYNKVSWLNIGVKKDDYFKPLKVRKEKPIVIYGTSIAQGGVASRPGMAWPSILGRAMDRQVINLGFSGNGRLEPEIIDIFKRINAKIFILDCLPNLDNETSYSSEVLRNKIINSVKMIRESNQQASILLVDHPGFTQDKLDLNKAEKVNRINLLQKSVFDSLITSGVNDLHYLNRKEINLSLDAMVDGIHPSDLGMQQYAHAYEIKLREILNEPKGDVTTTIPISQYREPGNYDWEDRHNEILVMSKNSSPKSIIIANSIIHFWGGLPKAKIAREPESWDNNFTTRGLRNYAYGWDRIENVLWRVYHEELDGFDADKILLMVGTNNLHLNNDVEILDGLEMLASAVKIRQPKSEIIMMGILPRRGYLERLENLNTNIKMLAKKINVSYDYMGSPFINNKSELNEHLFSDGLHPNKEGYLKLRNELNKILNKN